MLYKSLVLSTIFVFSACVERGFEVKVNTTTHTVTAEKSVDIHLADTKNAKPDFSLMQKAVTEKQNENKTSTKKVTTQHSKEKEKATLDLKEKKEKALALQKSQEEKARKALLEKQRKAKEAQLLKEEKEKLEYKLAKEKAAKEKAAKEALIKAKQEKEKTEQLLKAQKEKEALALKEEKERAALLLKLQKEKEAHARKLALEKARLAKEEKEEKLALERKLAEEKKRIAQEEAKRKAEQEKALSDMLKKEKEAQKDKEKKAPLATAQELIFEPSKKTYQKFGTSEIHGHVIYLTESGSQITLKNTKIYLVKQNGKVKYWYENFYLKNKESSSLNKTILYYLNATHLNVENNFSFYGLPIGYYYVIIESDYPASIAKNKKVYIAKKIKVDKYKKIMTVFSKKL